MNIVKALSTFKPLIQQSSLNLNLFNSKTFVNVFNFFSQFERLLSIKGVWLLAKTLNIVNNKCFFFLTFFYRSHKISVYKKKKLQKAVSLEKVYQKVNKKMVFFLENYFSFLKINLFFFSIKNFNKKVKKKVINFLYKKLNIYFKTFFVRRLNLYVDFLKLTALLYQNLIGSRAFLIVLGAVFKHLSKKVHNRFVSFLSYVFKLLIEIMPKERLYFRSSLKGLKFTIGGRLSGKSRASYKYIAAGAVPLQSFNKKVDYSKIHIYNLLGAFGAHLWVHKNN